MINPEYKLPGDVLLHEFMEPFNITKAELSKLTFLPLTRVDQIIKGKEKINADVALRLSKFFGNNAKFWLWLQIEHDIDTENKINEKEVEKIKPVDKSAAA